jgi:hypothetical protein
MSSIDANIGKCVDYCRDTANQCGESGSKEQSSNCTPDVADEMT